MHNKYINFSLILSSMILFSCAHHRDVRPNTSGIHEVILKSETKDGAYQQAKDQADHFCEQRKKMAYIEKEGAKYTGDMKEDDYKTAKTGSKIATGVGAAGMVFGGNREKGAGGVLATGGAIADGVIGKGYTYRMTFRCQ
ncbi:hypothetical protein N9N67_12155 [Bacteriovoracaceae bacterium]|nr:hypothetical protein [Bacteriovoracaceae bacterium]